MINSQDLEAVTRVHILDRLFGGPLRCRVMKGAAHCTRLFKNARGRGAHEWRCKGPYDLLMANMHQIPVPKLRINLPTFRLNPNDGVTYP